MAANNTVPLATVAKLLDLTERRVNQLAKDGVLPKAARGRYELVPVVRAYIHYLRQKAVNSDVGGDDYAAHRARLTKAKADMAEMEREQMSNDLIPVQDVKDAWEVMVSNMRSRILSVPTKAATTVFAANDITEAKKILKESVNEALAELAAVEVKTANPIRSSIVEPDNGANDEGTSTAARTKNK